MSTSRLISTGRLSEFCTKFIEAGCLAAVVVTPLFFNLYSRRVFEADKSLLLRSIATGIAVACLIRWIVSTNRVHFSQLIRTPFVLPVLALLAVNVFATCTAISPRLAWQGSYTRLQGLYTLLAYLVIFGVIAYGLAQRTRQDRLILTLILTSAPVAVYAILQRFGLDPIWGDQGNYRVASTIGNPIYLAAYLGLAFFLALGYGLNIIFERRGHKAWTTWTVAGICLLIVSAQLAAMAFANSRGPWLGWFGGLIIFFLLVAAIQRRRSLAWAAAGLGLAGALFLAALNLPNTPLAPLRDTPIFYKLGRLWAYEREDRPVIWLGALQLALPHEPVRFPDGSTDSLNLWRPLIGYGPESMYIVYGRFFPNELISQYGELPNTMIGRSHNETLDVWITTGLLGLLVWQGVWISLLSCGLRGIGLMCARRDFKLLAALWLGGGLVGGAMTILLSLPHYLGLGVPAGNLGGLAMYLLLRLRRPAAPSDNNHADAILLAALVAGICTHYIEIQVGIAVISTRLLFWVLAGLLVALGSNRMTEEETPPPGWIGAVSGYALVIALLLATLLFAFVRNEEQLLSPAYSLWRSLTYDGLHGRSSFAFLGVLATTWGLGLVASLAELTRSARFPTWRDGLVGAVLLGLLSAGLPILFGLGLAWQLSTFTPLIPIYVPQVVWWAMQRTGLLDSYIWTMFLLMVLAALALLAENANIPNAISARRWAWAVVIPIGLIAGAWINQANLNPIRADMLYQRGQVYDQFHEPDYAVALYQRALARAPYEDVYYRGLGGALAEKISPANSEGAALESLVNARTSLASVLKLSDTQVARLDCDASFYAARAAFEHGRALNPLNADHTAGQALVLQRWAACALDPAQKAERLQQSDQYYARAVSLRPHDVDIWNDWAALALEQGDREGALEKLEASIRLLPRYPATLALMEKAVLQQGQSGPAIR